MMWLAGILIVAGWVFSVCLHEFGHAIVAYWGGDTSVKDKGYLTLNPLKYTNPALSLYLPIIFLLMGGIALPGAAVYIDRTRLHNRWWDSAVSAAGPLASLLVTLLMAIPFWLGLTSLGREHWFWFCLAFLINLEFYVVLLNLMPIPGLDGYGILEPWLPKSVQQQLVKVSRFGIWFVFGLLWFCPPFNQTLWHWSSGISEMLGVPLEAAAIGYKVFRQQSNILLLGLIAILVLFQRKKGESDSKKGGIN